MRKNYLLYSDEEQTELYANVDTVEELKEETQYYSDGCWFVCDLIDDKFLVNERKYHKKVKFPKNPKNRDKIISNVDEFKWVK